MLFVVRKLLSFWDTYGFAILFYWIHLSTHCRYVEHIGTYTIVMESHIAEYSYILIWNQNKNDLLVESSTIIKR